MAWRKVTAAYRRVYDSGHLQADCQEPGSVPNPTLGSRVWADRIVSCLSAGVERRTAAAAEPDVGRGLVSTLPRRRPRRRLRLGRRARGGDDRRRLRASAAGGPRRRGRRTAPVVRRRPAAVRRGQLAAVGRPVAQPSPPNFRTCTALVDSARILNETVPIIIYNQ